MQDTGMQGSTPAGAQAEQMGEQASAGLDRLHENAQRTLDRYTHAASAAADRWAARGEELLHGPAAEKAKLYVREHPLTTIGIAVVVGLVLSKLLSRH